MQLAVVILMILGIACFVGVGVYFAHRYEKQRTQEIREAAEGLGLPFEEVSFSKVEAGVSGIKFFEQGHSKKFRNMMLGDTEDVDMAIFDYNFVVGHGKHAHHHQQTVVYFASPELHLPHFEVRPEGVFDKLGKVFGYQDINFDSHPLFSKKYLLRGENEAAIRRFFRPEILGVFESLANVCVEAGDHHFIFYRSGQRVKPEEIRGLMTEGFQVFKELKNSQVAG